MVTVRVSDKEGEMSPYADNGLSTVWARFRRLRVQRRGRTLGLLILVGLSFIIAACTPVVSDAEGIHVAVTLDIEEDPSALASATPSGDEETVLSPEETLRRDAEQYAEDVGVPLEEAQRRLQVQDDIGELNAALQANERDTFGGLWMEHEPEYRVIVLFTRWGKRTIRSYIQGKPWADLVEVQKASVTYAELQAIQAETIRALDKLAFEVSCALDVKGNRVEVWVTDREWFEKELGKAGIDLSRHVELVLVQGHSAKEVDICEAPSVPGVAFPRQAPVEGERATMAAELIGRLTLVDGCLRVNSIYGTASYLPIWPPEFALRAHDGEIQVLDGDGQVVAHVGQEVYMSGGEGSAASMPDCVREQLPAACTGPYWVVGDAVRPNLRHDSELFSLDVISTTERSLLFLRKKPVLDEWAEEGAPLVGKLVLYEHQRCLRIERQSESYVPLWPPEYEVRVEKGEVEVVDGSGQVIARAGEEVRLEGGKIPVSWGLEQYRRLYHELPGDCNGPYWIVGEH